MFLNSWYYDFCFLDACLGHQSSSATYSSSKWDVRRDHLQKHGGRPHTPDDCPKILRRSIADIESLYHENLVEDRKGSDTHGTGKYHGNFYNRAIFPILSLDNIVPPVLHIMLGIVLKLFNLLLNRCHDLDHSNNCATHIAETAQKERDFEKARLNLSVNENRKRELGCAFVDLYNCKERIEEVLAGTFSELDKIAIASDNKGKRKDSKFTRCTGIKCFMSAWDSEVNWVLCDGCNGWKHGFCELLTQNQQDALSEQDASESVCLSCQGFHLDNLMPRVDGLIGEMRVDLNTVEQAVLHSKTVCPQFQ